MLESTLSLVETHTQPLREQQKHAERSAEEALGTERPSSAEAAAVGSLRLLLAMLRAGQSQLAIDGEGGDGTLGVASEVALPSLPRLVQTLSAASKDPREVRSGEQLLLLLLYFLVICLLWTCPVQVSSPDGGLQRWVRWWRTVACCASRRLRDVHTSIHTKNLGLFQRFHRRVR